MTGPPKESEAASGRRSVAPSPGRSVTLVGLGNIGSYVTEQLARLPGLQRITLIDPDVYEPRNFAGQQIGPGDFGRPKVQVQARRLRELNPALEVRPLRMDVADVPLGQLRADLILAGLDSLKARLALNEAATRLGVLWVDGGVETAQQLIRVTTYLPGRAQPCYACGLNDADFQRLGQAQMCARGSAGAAPTGGAGRLGVLVAAHMAVEAHKLLAGALDQSLAGRQLLYAASHHRLYVTALRRDPACRFDHQPLAIQPLASLTPAQTLEAALARARDADGLRGPLSLAVPGKPFFRGVHCPSCGRKRLRFHLRNRLPACVRRCSNCGGREMLPAAFEVVARLSEGADERLWRHTLADAGLQAGDVLAISTPTAEHFYEIAPPAQESRPAAVLAP